MRVGDILASKGHDVATISQERTVADALQVLKERGIGALIVTGGAAPMVGIFSERDAVRALATRGARALEERIGDLMSSDVATCDEDTSPVALMGLMTERRIRHLPVVEGGRLVGIVSIGDVVKHHVSEIDNERRALRDYIATA